MENESKKFFLVASSDPERRKQISVWIHAKFIDAVVYTAADFVECTAKIRNVPPHLLIADYDLPKSGRGEVANLFLKEKGSRTATIILGKQVESELQSDAVAMGKMFFLEELTDQHIFMEAVRKVANFAFHSEVREFNLKFLKAGEFLIHENDVGKNVYILRKGEMKAYQTNAKGEKTLLGPVHMGEFVGEMAYFVGENRMATVEAVTDCEVVELPAKTFERVVYHRPSWVKNLFETLARRLARKAEIQKDKV